MGAACCGSGTTFEGLSADYKRLLWAVIAINAAMFLVEMTAGALAGSQALQADALDFLGDSLTYGISLAVIGAALHVAPGRRSKGAEPDPDGPVGVRRHRVSRARARRSPRRDHGRRRVPGARRECRERPAARALQGRRRQCPLGVAVLAQRRDRQRRRDACRRWACGAPPPWPDLVVAAIMAGLFLWSSAQILSQSARELRTGHVSGMVQGHVH